MFFPVATSQNKLKSIHESVDSGMFVLISSSVLTSRRMSIPQANAGVSCAIELLATPSPYLLSWLDELNPFLELLFLEPPLRRFSVTDRVEDFM